METFEVRPKSKRNALILAVLLIIAIAGGVIGIASGNAHDMEIGALCVVVCVPTLFLGVPRLMKRKVSLILTETTIEQSTLIGHASIHWEDIEKIGIADQGTGETGKLVGIRFKTYDRYLANLPPEYVKTFLKIMGPTKIAARALSLIPTPYAQYEKIWTVLSGTEDTVTKLRSIGKIGTLAEALIWNRDHYGYDIYWGWADRDRNAKEFAALLLTYHQYALTKRMAVPRTATPSVPAYPSVPAPSTVPAPPVVFAPPIAPAPPAASARPSVPVQWRPLR